MDKLPCGARIKEFNGVEAYKHLRRQPLCNQCYNHLTEHSQAVTIPPQEVNGIQYVGSSADTCSETCALEWINAYTPSVMQQEEEEHDSLILPTQENSTVWIYAHRQVGEYPKATDNSGKWLIWLSPTNIDRYWIAIRQAVKEGRLGETAKVSTAKSLKPEHKNYVMCVYTYNYEDKDDVMRIREELRKLGIRREIIYKKDEDTHFLRYSTNYTPVYRA